MSKSPLPSSVHAHVWLVAWSAEALIGLEGVELNRFAQCSHSFCFPVLRGKVKLTDEIQIVG